MDNWQLTISVKNKLICKKKRRNHLRLYFILLSLFVTRKSWLNILNIKIKYRLIYIFTLTDNIKMMPPRNRKENILFYFGNRLLPNCNFLIINILSNSTIIGDIIGDIATKLISPLQIFLHFPKISPLSPPNISLFTKKHTMRVCITQ